MIDYECFEPCEICGRRDQTVGRYPREEGPVDLCATHAPDPTPYERWLHRMEELVS